MTRDFICLCVLQANLKKGNTQATGSIMLYLLFDLFIVLVFVRNYSNYQNSLYEKNSNITDTTILSLDTYPIQD